MLINVGVSFFSSWSSAAWAKKALAVFRISLARRSSLISRSMALMRSRSPDVHRRATSLRLTQSSNVDGTQPILGGIDSTAAYSEEYS